MTLLALGAPPTSDRAPAATPAPVRLDLPGLVMRRAIGVAIVCLLAMVVLGAWRARTDSLREMNGSLDVARASLVLAQMRDGPLEDGLARLAAMSGLRHLQMALRDESGRVVAWLSDGESEGRVTRYWRKLSSWFGPSRASPELIYSVPLRDGRVWTVALSASPDSEILESASNLFDLFLLMIVCCGAMLAAMHWSVRRSLRPLRTLVDAIAGVERHEIAAVKALPTMPIRELEAIAHALRHLVAAQERSEAGRRVLAHRLMSLQEEERQRLARDLHDEFGQRLTALRVDASWLRRAADLDEKARRIVDGMGEQITLIQDDVRRLLARLRPLGVVPAGGEARPQTLGRLGSMLTELVRGWSGADRGQGVAIDLRLDGDGDVPLAEELVLGLYRITQEAVTNVMRHAAAGQCEIGVEMRTDEQGRPVLRWWVDDDGCGIRDLEAALRRGTGLAGLKERVWTLGGRFDFSGGRHGRGTSLRAEFRLAAGGVA